jgi:phage terminase Nu1 subunit (DNA packaging protein)
MVKTQKKQVTRNAPPRTKEKPSTEKKPKPADAELVSLDYLAETLGVTKRRISQFKEEKIITPARRGLYDKQAALVSLFAWYRDKVDKPTKPTEEMEFEKLRTMKAKAEREEMRVKKDKGELHHTEDIAAIFGNIFSRVHAGLESFPLGIAPLLTDNPNAMDIAVKIKEQLSKVLYEMTIFDFDLFVKTGGAVYVSALEADGADSETA